MQPLFIVFEGIDGSGKSTQAELLHSWFQAEKLDADLLREPSTGPWGKKIRTLLSGETVPAVEEMLRLFILDREDDARSNILPALESNRYVVMDRYFHSNAAYQGAMGLDARTILEENRRHSFPEPHRIYFIDVSAETAISRISLRNRGEQRDIFEKQSFLEKVRGIFLELADETFVVLDGEKPREDIHAEILKDLKSHFAAELNLNRG